MMASPREDGRTRSPESVLPRAMANRKQGVATCTSWKMVRPFDTPIVSGLS